MSPAYNLSIPGQYAKLPTAHRKAKPGGSRRVYLPGNIELIRDDVTHPVNTQLNLSACNYQEPGSKLSIES